MLDGQEFKIAYRAPASLLQADVEIRISRLIVSKNASHGEWVQRMTRSFYGVGVFGDNYER